MTQDRKTVVGAVEFTAQGVVITKTYNKPEDFNFVRVPFDCQLFLEYLKGRIDHCAKELNENILKATYISEEMILWPGGRFTRRVYDEMVAFYTYYVDRSGLDMRFLEQDQRFKGMCQQVIRHLYFEKIEDRDMFNILTEYITCA
jgi:hypothetical protein